MIKKIICIIPLLLLTLLFTFANNSHAQSISNDNLAAPDLQGKEYLGNGVYRLYDSNNVVVKYNIYQGTFHINGVPSNLVRINLYTNPDLINTTVSIKNLTGRDNIPFYVTWKTGVDFSGNLNNNQVSTANREVDNLSFQLLLLSSQTYDNVIYRIQLEQGTTATPYQVPKEPQVFFENMIYNNGFNEGYIEGFNDGLLEAFNLSNYLGYGNRENITNKTLGQAGPGSSWFGFEIKNIGIKISTINMFNLDKFSLFKSIDFSELGWHAGITLNYVGGGSSRIEFRNGYTEYEQDMTYYHNDDSSVDNILISFSHNGTTGFDWNEYFNRLRTEIGVYFNNEIYKGSYLEKIRELEFNKGVEIGLNSENNESYGIGYNVGYDNGLNIGYNKGVNENQANGGFGLLLTQVFGGIGSILSIELLPNMPIGAFIAVPIVFGIIFFIIGRKKE